MAKVFISYSRKDIEFAKRITDALKQHSLDFWIDWEGISPTVDWWKEIEKGIEEADAFLFLLSPDSAASKICNQEIDCAVKNGKRLIVLMVRQVPDDTIPKQLSHIQYLLFRETDDFEAGINKLLNAIHTDYDWVKAHRRLQMKALDWESAYKDKSFLLRGRDLAVADRQLKLNSNKSPYPTDLQKEYVLKSHRAINIQRMVTGLAVTVIIVITVLVGITYLLNQKSNSLAKANAALAAQSASAAQEAANENALLVQKRIQEDEVWQAHLLTVIAQLQLSKGGSDPTTPVLLATYVMRLSPNVDARKILQNYLLQNSKTSIGSDRELISNVCDILPRNLTRTEWREYISDRILVTKYNVVCPNLPFDPDVSTSTAVP